MDAMAEALGSKASDSGVALDIAAIGKLVQCRTLKAVALHFALLAEAEDATKPRSHGATKGKGTKGLTARGM